MKLGLEPCHLLLTLVSFLIYYAASSGTSDSYTAMKYKIMHDNKKRVKQNNFLHIKSHLIYAETLEFFILSKSLLKHFSTLFVFQICAYLFMVQHPTENSLNSFRNIIKISYILLDTLLLLIHLKSYFYYIFTYDKKWIQVDSIFYFTKFLPYFGI